MVSKNTLAEWWCQLNMHGWPEELGRIPSTVNVADFTRGAFLVLDVIARKEGRALWQKKCEQGHKSTGEDDGE